MSVSPRTNCEVCGRSLQLLDDQTVRAHKPPGQRGEYGSYCGGSRHRQTRWPVGQRLHHHAGSLWEVVADLSTTSPHRDYEIRCVEGRKGNITGDTLIAHGEYMHRDGWWAA